MNINRNIIRKLCLTCEERQPLRTAFDKCDSNFDGYDDDCKRCKRSAKILQSITIKGIVMNEEVNTEPWKIRLVKRTKKRCEKENIIFDLQPEDIIVPDVCPVLKIPMFRGKGKKIWRCDNTPSIDRIVPSLGYVKHNVRCISWLANRIKSDQINPQIFLSLYQDAMKPIDERNAEPINSSVFNNDRAMDRFRFNDTNLNRIVDEMFIEYQLNEVLKESCVDF